MFIFDLMKRLIGFLSVVLALLFSPLVSFASTHAQNEKSFIEKVEKVESVVIVVDLKVDKQFNNINKTELIKEHLVNYCNVQKKSFLLVYGNDTNLDAISLISLKGWLLKPYLITKIDNTNFKPYLITKIDNTNFKPYSISLNYNQHWLKC